MQPAQDRYREHLTGGLVAGLLGQPSRHSLPQPLVRSRLVEIRDVFRNGPAKLLLVQDEDVIEALSTDAAEKPLADRVRPGRSDRRADDLAADAGEHVVELRAKLVVTIADEESWALAERRRLAQLLGCPVTRRVPRHRGVDHAPAAVLDDEEEEDRAEAPVVGLEEIAGPDLAGVILEERRPGLASLRSPALPDLVHVLLDGALADANADLQQLAANPLGTPQREMWSSTFPALCEAVGYVELMRSALPSAQIAVFRFT